MPLRTEHTCRLVSPGDCRDESFRRVNNAREHAGKSYHVIYARLKSDNSWVEQSFRYPVSQWNEAEARSHCQDHDGIRFEPAVNQESKEGEFMALTHNSTTADNEPAWSDVDKTKLPRIAHADMGEPDKKSTWAFPHHFVRNGEIGTDANGNEGVYISGDMYLHEDGLDTAWAYAQGARTGEEASQEVKDHLQVHRRALGKVEEDEEGEDNASGMGHPASAYIRGSWAITTEGMASVRAMAKDAEKQRALLTDEGTKPKGTRLTSIRGDVAIIEAIGPIFQYPNFLTWIFGLPTAEALGQEYRRALDDPSVKSIVLWIDSPGGMLGGISELAGQIAKGKEKKRTVAYVGDLGASAAYWIASAASEVVAVDTAQIGSIGVVMGLMLDEDEDVIEVVSSQSPRKRPDPKTNEGLRQLQERVDALAQVFVKSVSEYRNLDRDSVLQLGGDVAIAARAIQVGLADRLGSLEEVIEELQTTKTGEDYMEITAQNIKGEYPQVAEELQSEGRSEARRDQQEQDLALAGAILGEEAQKKLKEAMDSGLTADQLQKAQQIVGSTKSQTLEGLEQAHGSAGVGVQPEGSSGSSLSQAAAKRKEGKS